MSGAPVADRVLIAKFDQVIADGPEQAVTQECADLLVVTIASLVGNSDGAARWLEENSVPEAARWHSVPLVALDAPVV